MQRNLVVVGGGISGLAAAWEASADPSTQVTVLDAADRLGGKIHTSEFLGRRVDEGADAFLRRVPEALELCREIGIAEEDLVSPSSREAWIWASGELHRLPGGLVMGVPTDFAALEASGILSAEGLARARMDANTKNAPLLGDAAVGELVTDRFGPEVTQRLVAPLLGGINAGDVDAMSVDAVVPQLGAAARVGGSLSAALRRHAPADFGPIFSAPRAGMGALIDTLVTALTARGVKFELGRAVTQLPAADAVILTTPANVSAGLIGDSPEAAAILGAVQFASVVFVTVGYERASIEHPLDGSGFLLPRDAGFDITAASWASTKWAHLADNEVVLLRVALGHVHDPRPIEWSDAEITDAVRRDLQSTMGISATPLDMRITRYRDGFPQYGVGHLDRIAKLEAALARDLPHVGLCGMAHRGVGIPACIREARRAVREVVARD